VPLVAIGMMDDIPRLQLEASCGDGATRDALPMAPRDRRFTTGDLLDMSVVTRLRGVLPMAM